MAKLMSMAKTGHINGNPQFHDYRLRASINAIIANVLVVRIRAVQKMCLQTKEWALRAESSE